MLAHGTPIPNLALSIPEVLYQQMKKHPEIRWSEVARQALAGKLDELRVIERLLEESRLRPEDVDSLAGKIKESVLRRHRATKRSQPR